MLGSKKHGTENLVAVHCNSTHVVDNDGYSPRRDVIMSETARTC